MILRTNSDFLPVNSNNILMIYVMVKCCVLFHIRTELLDGIWKSFGFKRFSAFFTLCARNERTQGWLCLPSVCAHGSN
jgi:hypothetical protein